MCVANSARSQMAEGLARKILGPDFWIESAGSEPKSVNSFAVEVLQEVGIDITQHFSKSFDQLDPSFKADLNYVITLCAEEVCPVVASKSATRLHWPHKDPASNESAEVQLANFRVVRDQITQAIEEFKVKTFSATQSY